MKIIWRGRTSCLVAINGFMQEVVALPLDRVVAYPEEVRGPVTALAEFSSVAMHAIHRFDLIAHQRRESVLILGDGSLSYVVATSFALSLSRAEDYSCWA